MDDVKPLDPSYDYPKNYVSTKKHLFWIDWVQILLQNCSGSVDSIEKIKGLAASASELAEDVPPEMERIVTLVKHLADNNRFFHPELKTLAKEAHKELSSKKIK